MIHSYTVALIILRAAWDDHRPQELLCYARTLLGDRTHADKKQCDVWNALSLKHSVFTAARVKAMTRVGYRGHRDKGRQERVIADNAH